MLESQATALRAIAMEHYTPGTRQAQWHDSRMGVERDGYNAFGKMAPRVGIASSSFLQAGELTASFFPLAVLSMSPWKPLRHDLDDADPMQLLWNCKHSWP